jgi:molybdenum cofactor guanylyltransferase
MFIQGLIASQVLFRRRKMLNSYRDICASAALAVLVGGQSSRMGIAKSHLKIDEIPILEFLFKRLRWPGPTILVDAPGREKPPGHELFEKVITDPVAGEGPLRGILTAMEQTISPLLIVIPVDMPCMTIEALAVLAGVLHNQSVNRMAMFRRDGELEPLPAAFVVSQACPVIREQLNGCNASLHGLTRVMNTTLVHIDPSWPETLWVNLNHPADVEQYLQNKRIGAAP